MLNLVQGAHGSQTVEETDGQPDRHQTDALHLPLDAVVTSTQFQWC